MLMTETGHLAGYSDIGRTEVEPMPADPDFKASGVWLRVGAYPAARARRRSRQRRQSAIATGTRTTATTRGHSWQERGACAG